MEGFSSLPPWAQITATMVSVIIAMTIALSGYFKKSAQSKSEGPSIVEASLADDGLIRDLNHGIKHLDDRLYDFARKIDRATEALESITELLIEEKRRRGSRARRS